MSLNRKSRSAALFALAGALVLLHHAPAFGWGFNLWGCEKCPPPYHHCQEGPPRLKYERICPRPVCCPEGMENFGYFPTCWQPGPWALNCNHCPPYGPAAMAPQAAVPPPAPNVPAPSTMLSTPRSFTPSQR